MLLNHYLKSMHWFVNLRSEIILASLQNFTTQSTGNELKMILINFLCDWYGCSAVTLWVKLLYVVKAEEEGLTGCYKCCQRRSANKNCDGELLCFRCVFTNQGLRYHYLWWKDYTKHHTDYKRRAERNMLLAGCTALPSNIHIIKNELGVNEANIRCLSFVTSREFIHNRVLWRKCDKRLY